MTTPSRQPDLPRHTSPQTDPTLSDCFTRLMSDPGAVIPASIYSDWSYKVAVPQGPLVISQPEAIEKVLFDVDKVFGRNRQTQTLMRRGWNDELAAATGEKWLTQRRAAAPAFRAKSVAAYVPEISRTAQSAEWSNRHIELSFETGRIVSEVVLKTLLAGHSDHDYDSIARDLPAYMRQITKFGLADFMPVSESFLDTLRGLPKSPERLRLRKVADALARERLESAETSEDVIALLKDKSKLSDIIFGFMGAGVETTAMGTAWALYLLALHPDWQSQIRQEAEQATAIESGEAKLAALPLTLQVVKEAMRLYPPAPILVRTAQRQTAILGHKVKKGQVVILNIHALHRHEKIWKDPSIFHPERFSETAPSRHRAAFIPFSAGPRMCLAMNFALAEMTILVSELARTYQLAPVKPEPNVSLQITTHSTTGLNVTATKI